ncbi:MAG: ArnT family glycosyltransferase [bacterium]
MSKKIVFPLGILLLIYTILSILYFDPKLFTGGDNAVYITLAESIASGKGYKNIYLPDTPEHTQYPPGFPLLLSLFIIIFGKNIFVLKIVIFLTGLIGLIFMYNIVTKIFKDNAGLFMLFYLSIPILVIYNHWILSEIPFLFFSLGAVYFFMRYQEENKFWLFILSSVFAICTFFTRTAGIALILAYLLYLFISRNYKSLLIFIVLFLFFLIPWQMRISQASISGGYLDQLLAKNPYQMELGRIGFVEMLIRIWENFVFYSFTIIPTTILPLLKSELILIFVGVVFLVLVIAGIINNFKCFALIDAYFIISMLVLFIWPRVWSSERFFLPLIPFFLIYFFKGIILLQKKLKAKFFLTASVGLTILLNIFAIIPQIKTSITTNLAYLRGSHYAGYPLDWQRYFEMISWIDKNIPENKVIMARKPEFVYLLSGHKSFCYPFTLDTGEIKESIKKADYILFDNFQWTATTYRYLLPVLQQTPEKFSVIHKTKSPEFFLLKVLN